MCSERDDRIIKWPIPLHLVADHVGDSPQIEKAPACTNLNQADTSLSSLTTDRKSREQLQFLGRKPELQLEKVTYFPEFLDSARKNASWKWCLQEQTAELLQNWGTTQVITQHWHRYPCHQQVGTSNCYSSGQIWTTNLTFKWSITHSCPYSPKRSHSPLQEGGLIFVSSIQMAILYLAHFYSHSHKHTEKLRSSSGSPHSVTETGSSGIMN